MEEEKNTQENLDNSNKKQHVADIVKSVHPELTCPYDIENYGRCYYPYREGKCTCVLRHHTSSKTYSF